MIFENNLGGRRPGPPGSASALCWKSEQLFFTCFHQRPPEHGDLKDGFGLVEKNNACVLDSLQDPNKNTPYIFMQFKQAFPERNQSLGPMLTTYFAVQIFFWCNIRFVVFCPPWIKKDLSVSSSFLGQNHPVPLVNLTNLYASNPQSESCFCKSFRPIHTRENWDSSEIEQTNCHSNARQFVH